VSGTRYFLREPFTLTKAAQDGVEVDCTITLAHRGDADRRSLGDLLADQQHLPPDRRALARAIVADLATRPDIGNAGDVVAHLKAASPAERRRLHYWALTGAKREYPAVEAARLAVEPPSGVAV
jgi:hypothetical protein